jgi:hypothetical protein
MVSHHRGLFLVTVALILLEFFATTEKSNEKDDVPTCTSRDEDEDGTCLWSLGNDDDDDTDDDVTTTTAPKHYMNHELHAQNIMELDVPIPVIASIRRDYEKDIAPYWHTNQSTPNFCLVTPYASGVKTWGSLIKEVRSDIRWYSVNNEPTYQRYLQQHIYQLGLLDRIREWDWIPVEEELTVFSIFFIPRSFSNKYQFHEDWGVEVGSQVITILVPLSSHFKIGLAYRDNTDEIRLYNYTLGKAIAVAGGMMHSTGLGQSTTSQDVLLCVYVGGKNWNMWKYTQNNIADELEHYQHPFKGFIRNEYLDGRKSKCQ